MRHYLVKVDELLIPADKLEELASALDGSIAVDTDWSTKEYKLARPNEDKVRFTPFSMTNYAKLMLERADQDS
jgi:hypothetical protein